MTSAILSTVEVAKIDPYRPELRSYHVLGTVHEMVETDDDGAITSVLPAIGGQSRTQIARMFNTVLIPQTNRSALPLGKLAPLEVERFCWSVPPDKFRACGDGVGGGKYQTLPTKVGGTYEELVKAWGM